MEYLYNCFTFMFKEDISTQTQEISVKALGRFHVGLLYIMTAVNFTVNFSEILILLTPCNWQNAPLLDLRWLNGYINNSRSNAKHGNSN